MSPIYRTRTLSNRIFRLLLLQPSLDPNQPLECFCYPYDMDTAPSYEALSYVWGTPDPSTDIAIQCNGETIVVGNSLARALERLRLTNSTRTTWVDAICINQVDNEEKSYQVPLMGSIYSSATRVMVWLGDGDLHQIRETTLCVRLIATACRLHDLHHGSNTNRVDRYENVNLRRDIFSTAPCAGMQELYSRPWFSRIWCVQEIRLAQDAVVIWDAAEMSWSEVGLAASWIFDHSQGPRDIDTEARFLSVLRVEHADLMYNDAMERDSLLGTLRSHREWKSSNPRDMVYGLLSLVEPQAETEALKPDYNKTEGDVFADTVLVTIRLYSRLTTLAYISHPEGFNGHNGYRSWAPRWDMPEVADALGVPESSCPWSACAGKETEISIASNLTSEQLCLIGVFYDAVVSVGQEMDGFTLRDPEQYAAAGMHPFLSVYEQKKTEVSLPESYEGNEYDDWCAFARTLTAGSIGSSYIHVHTDQDAQLLHLKSCIKFLDSLQRETLDDTQNYTVPDGMISRYMSDSYFYCNQRRFFWTENGTFGLGPICMCPGDIVVVLYGGNTPYVLRSKGNQYLFLGQAYVDNLMQGELVGEVHAGRSQSQEFCLV
jgi:hypothetical protein